MRQFYCGGFLFSVPKQLLFMEAIRIIEVSIRAPHTGRVYDDRHVVVRRQVSIRAPHTGRVSKSIHKIKKKSDKFVTNHKFIAKTSRIVNVLSATTSFCRIFRCEGFTKLV